MMVKVFRLELESHTVSELFMEILDGIIKGNIEHPAVKIMLATVMALKIKALPGLLMDDSTNVMQPVIKVVRGSNHKSGKCP